MLYILFVIPLRFLNTVFTESAFLVSRGWGIARKTGEHSSSWERLSKTCKNMGPDRSQLKNSRCPQKVSLCYLNCCFHCVFSYVLLSLFTKRNNNHQAYVNTKLGVVNGTKVENYGSWKLLIWSRISGNDRISHKVSFLLGSFCLSCLCLSPGFSNKDHHPFRLTKIMIR